MERGSRTRGWMAILSLYNPAAALQGRAVFAAELKIQKKMKCSILSTDDGLIRTTF